MVSRNTVRATSEKYKMNEMSKASFNVLYDGPALTSSEMDVRDLAPALLALGNLLEEANSALNDGRAQISVKVKASFKTGCFGIELDVTQTFLQQINIIFSCEKVSTAKQLLEWLGLVSGTGTIVYGATKGLLGLLRWLRGRSFNRVVLLDNGLVRIELDGDHFEVEQQVIELYRQAKLRAALQAVVKPLESPGITEFAVTDKAQKQRFVVVTSEDLEFFAAPVLAPELLSEQEVEMNLQLLNIAFKDDNKWRFSDGSASFYAQVADHNVLEQVRRNETFSGGDILKARLKRTQSLTGDSMKTEYVLLEVIEHRRAASQIPMQFDVEQPKD